MAKKTIPVIIEDTKQVDKTFWQKTKDWFHHSESIALAYIVQITGLMTGLVGAMDWSPFISLFQTGTDFTQKQLIGLGVVTFFGGVTAYVARVRGTKEVEGRLLPKSE